MQKSKFCLLSTNLAKREKHKNRKTPQPNPHLKRSLTPFFSARLCLKEACMTSFKVLYCFFSLLNSLFRLLTSMFSWSIQNIIWCKLSWILNVLHPWDIKNNWSFSLTAAFYIGISVTVFSNQRQIPSTCFHIQIF